MIHLHNAPSALAAVMRARGLELAAFCAHVHSLLFGGRRQGDGVAGNRSRVGKDAHDVGPFGHKAEYLHLGEKEHALPCRRHHRRHNNGLHVKMTRGRDEEEQIGGKEDEVDYDAGEHSAATVVQPVLRVLLRTAQVLAHRKNMPSVCRKQKTRKELINGVQHHITPAHYDLLSLTVHNVEVSFKLGHPVTEGPVLKRHRKLRGPVRRIHRKRITDHIESVIYSSPKEQDAT